MTHHPGFLQAILEAPPDDTPRLVYADWLQENGEEDYAKFIRLQIELAEASAANALKALALCKTCNGLLAAHSPGTDCPNEVRWLGEDSPLLPEGFQGQLDLAADFYWEWWRGFVARVETDAQSWLAHGDALTASHPIEILKLDNWPQQERIVLEYQLYFHRESKLVRSKRWPRIREVVPPEEVMRQIRQDEGYLHEHEMEREPFLPLRNLQP